VPATAPRRVDWLPAALCAAELGEPFDVTHAPIGLFDEFSAALPSLRVTVPYAALRLLGRFAVDARDEVRAGVAHALPWFTDLYAGQVEQLLLVLACDPARKVQKAAAHALADLLGHARDADELINRWQWHPDRARRVLADARALIPPPLGTR
jgi:hypothetical protein